MHMSGYNIATFNSRRSPVFARNGVVATAHPLATAAGLRALQDGGNAVDAAIAACAVLAVAEPHQMGLGGDLFALVHEKRGGRTYALNASGPAPAAANLADYRARGWTAIPQHSPLAWTVPGMVGGWDKLASRFGSIPLPRLLEPAIGYAKHGLAIPPVDASYWEKHRDLLMADAGCRECLLVDGRLPRAGDVLVQPVLARTLNAIAEGGSEAFYKGDPAAGIVRFSREAGGLIEAADLAAFSAEWQEPIGYDYRGHRILECPPNGQGLAALLALRNVADLPIGDVARGSADCLHWLIEATKHAMAEAGRIVCDPRHLPVDVEGMLAAAAPRIGKMAHLPGEKPAPRADTIYLATADREGNAVSLIASVYGDFGSGYLNPYGGFILQNRGSGFSLDPGHPNCLAPGKRPYHTIIPAMAMKDGAPAFVFGMTGGFLQPQGHLQLVTSLLDHGLDVQSAIDLPRFWWEGKRRVAVEDGFDEDVYRELARRGHEILRKPGHQGFGGAYIIRFAGDGVIEAGAEPRQDGFAAGW
ncbi:MAG: gamma-glutamyltransferase [Alphaproteobacteria bacterium]|nr:MAG: gamma-glutamyltransferase [Alphaproteobacteria bacterium]